MATTNGQRPKRVRRVPKTPRRLATEVFTKRSLFIQKGKIPPYEPSTTELSAKQFCKSPKSLQTKMVMDQEGLNGN